MYKSHNFIDNELNIKSEFEKEGDSSCKERSKRCSYCIPTTSLSLSMYKFNYELGKEEYVINGRSERRVRNIKENILVELDTQQWNEVLNIHIAHYTKEILGVLLHPCYIEP